MIKAILFVAEGIQPSIKMFEIVLVILKSINARTVIFKCRSENLGIKIHLYKMDNLSSGYIYRNHESG